MSEEIKQEVKIETAKDITIETAKENNSDIFISASDVFTVSVDYYKLDNQIIVKDIDENFDTTRKSQNISVVLRRPSFQDYRMINEISKSNISSVDSKTINAFELNTIQFSRLVTLANSWNCDKPLSDIGQVNVKILKAIMGGIVREIGFDGII